MNRRCKECQTDIPKDAKFCSECGTPVKSQKDNTCAACNAKNAQNAKFCKKCGADLSGASTPKKGADSISALSKHNLYILSAAGIIALLITIIYHYVGFVQPIENKQAVLNQPVQQQQEHNHPETAELPPPPSPEEINAVAEQLKNDPESGELNTQMGNLLFDSGRFEEAIPYYQKSLSLVPNNPDLIVDLGVCFFNMQEYSKAQEKFESALNIDRKHVNALYNMGVVAVQLGDVDRLIEFWGILREVAPNSQQAARATQILEQIHQNMGEMPGGGESPSE